MRFDVGKSVRVPESRCLSCGALHDGATGVDVSSELIEKPDPGTITVCFACGHIMALDEELLLRELTDDEAREIAGDPRIIAIQRARKKMSEL